VTSGAVYEQLYGINIHNFTNAYSYIRVSGNASTIELEQKLNELYDRQDPDAASVSRFHVRPMTAIHLHSSANGELAVNSNASYVYLFTFVAVIILGIACVNFATLATARSVRRAREMAMRKVFGAEKSGLIAGFLLEGVLLAVAGLTLAYL